MPKVYNFVHATNDATATPNRQQLILAESSIISWSLTNRPSVSSVVHWYGSHAGADRYDAMTSGDYTRQRGYSTLDYRRHLPNIDLTISVNTAFSLVWTKNASTRLSRPAICTQKYGPPCVFVTVSLRMRLCRYHGLSVSMINWMNRLRAWIVQLYSPGGVHICTI